MTKDNTPDDDEKLWSHATRDTTPIKREKLQGSSPSHTGVSNKKPNEKDKQEANRPAQPKEKHKKIEQPERLAGKEIDSRTAQKLKRGQIPIDATLDLHGMNQPEAHSTLIRFIQNAYNKGQRHILIITGKGKSSEGVLRKNVPYWLKDSSIDHLILETRNARREHGGEGALSLLIRRNRAL